MELASERQSCFLTFICLLIALIFSYGPQGAHVIVATISYLLPDSFLPEKIGEIPYKLFIRKVLLPEAVLLLIQEDQGLDAETSEDVLFESNEYGLVQFSDKYRNPEMGVLWPFETQCMEIGYLAEQQRNRDPSVHISWLTDVNTPFGGPTPDITSTY